LNKSPQLVRCAAGNQQKSKGKTAEALLNGDAKLVTILKTESVSPAKNNDHQSRT
jgi:hypothetical protein